MLIIKDMTQTANNNMSPLLVEISEMQNISFLIRIEQLPKKNIELVKIDNPQRQRTHTKP